MRSDEETLSFGGHLEVLRQMLFRIVGVIFVFSCIVFCCKAETFDILLAPSDSSFITYCWVEKVVNLVDPTFNFDVFDIGLIATDLSSQFMSHLTASLYLGLLGASPFVTYELFRFVSPALLENEKRHSIAVVASMYALFILGVLMTYYVLFPISFRFLGTYTVADKVRSMITLDSYISTFMSLTLLMGLVFQLPVMAFILAKMGMLKHAIIILAVIAEIITPPDVLTLIMVVVPLYGLYELSILILKHTKSIC